LVRDGLQADILSFPADEETRFWAWSSFQEWSCTEASLHVVAPGGSDEVLADFRACPISLIQRSAPFHGEAEVVVVGDQPEDYDGLVLTNKVVLSRGDLRRVWELAVVERGAVGILYDGMLTVEPVRPEGALPDARQYSSFWWRAGDTKCFGFVLTPRQGQALRRMLQDKEEPVRVRAKVDSRLYDGTFEIVEATIPGKTEQEIVVVSHLCHPQPSANDNASGAAAALEAARALHALIANHVLPHPQRTIRFLWLPEITGTLAYLSAREEELDRLIAGINLDMVGQDQDQTGSSWLIECPPAATASFAPDLLAWLRDQLLRLDQVPDVSPSHTGMGSYPLYRQAKVPFSGGSDHLVLSDPTVDVPTPMLIQWPDRFYHTTADTPERTSPSSLARAGSLAAAYAYWLATASNEEATWLGYEMIARFKCSLAEATQNTLTETSTAPDDAPGAGKALDETLARLDRHLDYMRDRQKVALDTLQRLAPVECVVTKLQTEAERIVERELAWVRGFVDLQVAALELNPGPSAERASLSGEEEQASRLVPVRQVRGPISLRHFLDQLADEDRVGWHQLLEAREDRSHHTLTALALYWADGARSVLDIIDLVELETGARDVGLLLAYFQLLKKLELISFQKEPE
jgi:hypothetical protein